ncbi:hypothetical protein M2R47_05855 [Moraxella sp. Tifton1]|uniref:hypothetical protein n=1 Tax=Moraxella oculi TaxID=2940516 RepID=UPI002012F43A|nr:hypothetical protein [Moraxella sp. Tifton1]MCL1623763.1 hypothetical protein [Moraxella sp. Tifton1]
MNKQRSAKIYTLPLIALLGLSLVACQKSNDQPVEEVNTTNTTEVVKDTEYHHDDAHETHDHDHEDHDEHEHHHALGDEYQCNDGKSVQISVHKHTDGDIEAHATLDDITYDLEPKGDNKYHTDDGFDDKDMTLTMNADKAVFIDKDGATLLSCKKS